MNNGWTHIGRLWTDGTTSVVQASAADYPDAGLLIEARSPASRVTVRSCTEPDDSACFARRLHTPLRPCREDPAR